MSITLLVSLRMPSLVDTEIQYHNEHQHQHHQSHQKHTHRNDGQLHSTALPEEARRRLLDAYRNTYRELQSAMASITTPSMIMQYTILLLITRVKTKQNLNPIYMMKLRARDSVIMHSRTVCTESFAHH